MASRFSIEAVFRAVDRMTRPLQKMGLNSKRFTQALRRDFAKAQRSVAAFGASVKRFAGRALRIGIIGGLAAAGFAVAQFVKQASKIEDAVAAFTPLVGGVQAAENIIDKLNQTAATTPFQLESLADATKILLGFGAATEDTIIPVLRMLGDTAGGSSDRLERISLAFGKIQALGRVTMKEINQLISAGIPIIGELSDVLDVTPQKLSELIRQGKVSNKDITKAFQNMTSEGGKFFKGMEIASATLTGKFSTFKDNVALTAAAFGDVLLPILKDFLDKGISAAANIKDWVTANQELIKTKVEKFIEKVVRFTKEAVRIFKIIINVIDTLKPLIIGIAIVWGIYKVAMIAASIAQIALNVAMTANPIGIIIVAIGALVAGIIWLTKNWDKVSAAMQKVWDFMKRIAAWIKDTFLAQIQKVIDGFKIIGKFTGLDKESREARREAREEGGTQRRGRGVVTTRQSISETTNRSELTVRNDGTTDVETDSGIIRPGGSIILAPSG